MTRPRLPCPPTRRTSWRAQRDAVWRLTAAGALRSRDTKLKAVLRTCLLSAVDPRRHSVTWRIPKTLKPGSLRFCIVATDRTGNHKAPVCEHFRVR